MEDNDKKMYKEVVENIFVRWTALKLAVEHGMGGKTGQQTAVDSMNYVYEYCIGNDNVTESEIQEILEDIMDEEFDTICEDNSPAEISSMLVKYLKMIQAKQYDTIRTEVSAMPQCQTQWLNPNFKVEYKKDSAVMMKTRKWKSVAIRMFRVRAEQMRRSPMKTDGRRLLRKGDDKVVNEN